MIDNYKDLLYAIVNSDEEDKGNFIICVYDTKDSDKLCVVFNNLSTCAKFFNTSRGSISTAIMRKSLRAGRYRIERFRLEDL